jgi:hypothetical protein
MNKIAKILIIFLVIDLIVVLGYFGYRAVSKEGSGSDPADYEWIRIDENYVPGDYIEEFILNDSRDRGLLPVFIRNYGQDAKILKKFRGRHFAGPNETQLRMKFRDMEDWQLIDLKYTTEEEREVQRTILYVMEDGVWKVGDNGNLVR